MGLKLCDPPLHMHVRHALIRVFYRYGHVVGRYPWPFIVIPVVILASLGAGIVTMTTSRFDDDVNLPHNVQSYQDRAAVGRLFPDRTAENYDALELYENQIMGTLIFIAKNNASVYDKDVINEIRQVITDVKKNVTIRQTVKNNAAISDVKNNVTTSQATSDVNSNVTGSATNGEGSDVVVYGFEDLCGKRRGECVVTGERMLDPQFDAMIRMGILTFPKWRIPTTGALVDLSFALADSDRDLKRVGVVRVTFKLRHDLKPLAFAWEDAFVEHMKKVKVNGSDIVFSASKSASKELDRSFQADVSWVWACLGVMAVITCLVTCGGDAVSTRALFAPLAVTSPFLGVVSGWGVVSLCGVSVVDMVWATPILVFVIGVMNTWLLLTSWSGHLQDSGGGRHVPQRVGRCLADVGVAMTVSTLAVGVTMCAVYATPFPSVANVGLFAGVGVLLCHVCTMTFTVGCLALHGRRVLSSRHTATCQVTASPEQLRKEGRGRLGALLCAGEIPVDNYADQGWLERGPRLLLTKLSELLVARAVTCVLFLAVLAAAIYGILHVSNDVDVIDLLPEESYVTDYFRMSSRYFGFSFPVIFVAAEGTVYNQRTVGRMARLLAIAQQDADIESDFVRCWLLDFNSSDYRANLSMSDRSGVGASATSLTNTSPPSSSSTAANSTDDDDATSTSPSDVYMKNTLTPFPPSALKSFVMSSDEFKGDVAWDGDVVRASRCYVFSRKTSNQGELTGLMERMRRLAGTAGFSVFAFHPVFLSYDQTLAIMPTMYQIAGIALLVTALLVLLAVPDLVSVVVVVVANAVTSIVTLMGFMTFTSVPASFVSMPAVALSIGLAVYFSVPVMAAYMQSRHSQRPQRVADAVARAAGPLFVGGLTLFLGLLVFASATSFAFAVFFKVIIIAVVVVVFLAALVTPAILSWVGTEKSQAEKEHDDALKAELLLQDGGSAGSLELKDFSPNAGVRHLTRANGTDVKHTLSLVAVTSLTGQVSSRDHPGDEASEKADAKTNHAEDKAKIRDPSCVYCIETIRKEESLAKSRQAYALNTFPRRVHVTVHHDADYSDEEKAHDPTCPYCIERERKVTLAKAATKAKSSEGHDLPLATFPMRVHAKDDRDPSCVYCMFPRGTQGRPTSVAGPHENRVARDHSNGQGQGQDREVTYDIPGTHLAPTTSPASLGHGGRPRPTASPNHMAATLPGSPVPPPRRRRHVREPEYVNVSPAEHQEGNALQAEPRSSLSSDAPVAPVRWKIPRPKRLRDSQQRESQNRDNQHRDYQDRESQQKPNQLADYQQPADTIQHRDRTYPRPHSFSPASNRNSPASNRIRTVSDSHDVAPPPWRLRRELGTSLEGVHHVACTLSESGYLGGSQQYVSQNLADIPQ